ncbi:MAG: hypothetical protein ACXAE3_08220 [Candidatus Kariarchaeaceae archaeon]|jgi:hypothetical protein
MSDIIEVQLINSAGLPVYYHNNTGEGNYDDSSMILQSSFITAIGTFATELQNGEVKLIQFELKKYLMTRAKEFSLIFTSSSPDINMVDTYNGKINEVKDYLDTKLLQDNLDFESPHSASLDDLLIDFDSYLRKEKLVVGGEYERNSIREDVRSLIFKSVGYEPGKCNIGRSERIRRLNFGLTFFIISAVLLTAIVLLNLPSYLIFGLFVTNFLGFLGLLQYFYRFCTTNALAERYVME